MSISNRHPVNKFTAGKSEPMHGQRLAKVGYKSTQKTPAKYPSVCASIPMIAPLNLSEQQLESLTPHIITLLESAQDGIFRSLYESSDGTMAELADADISIDACISYLEAESQGSRLTKEYLESWFDQMVKDNLTVVIATKLGYDLSTPEQELTVSKHLNGYRGLITALAGGKTMLQSTQIDGLLRVLEVASVDDETSQKLIARLVAMKNKPKIEDLLEL